MSEKLYDVYVHGKLVLGVEGSTISELKDWLSIYDCYDKIENIVKDYEYETGKHPMDVFFHILEAEHLLGLCTSIKDLQEWSADITSRYEELAYPNLRSMMFVEYGSGIKTYEMFRDGESLGIFPVSQIIHELSKEDELFELQGMLEGVFKDKDETCAAGLLIEIIQAERCLREECKTIEDIEWFLQTYWHQYNDGYNYTFEEYRTYN